MLESGYRAVTIPLARFLGFDLSSTNRNGNSEERGTPVVTSTTRNRLLC